MMSDRRRSYSAVPMLFLAAAMIIAGVSPLLAQQKPVIKFKEEVWNFGDTKQGKVLTHVFSFQNTGDVPLVIHNVRTSCGCAAALISQREVQPGKDGEIKVTFNTRGYEGNQTKYIYVDSNDPSNPKKQLTVKASIDVPPRPQIELDRYTIDLGLLLESEGIETQAKVANPGEQELTVEFSHKDAVFSLGNKPMPSPLRIPAGQEVSVTMKLTPRRNLGLIREYVLLRTNDPLRPNLSLYLSGYIVTTEQLQDLFDRYKDKLKDNR